VDIERLAIPDILVLKPKRHGDDRGFFSETYNRQALAEAGVMLDFVQDNHAHSACRGTVRGIHFQLPPFAQAKLIRVVRGAIFDVAVDLRRGSPSYGQHVAVELSAGAWNQILIPMGFGHGLCTLTDDTEVLYKVSDYYAPNHDRGVLWNDSDLGIDWPVGADEAILSEKDRRQPRLRNLPSCFEEISAVTS
jgi:dTDP-4-dehydrorhamnose 3,5-epimerase